MPAGEEVVRADSGEAHRVLPVLRHPDGTLSVEAEHPVVGGGVQAAVGGVELDPVHVAGARFAGVGHRVGCGAGGCGAAGHRDHGGEDEQDRDEQHRDMTTSHGDSLWGGTRRPGTSRYPDAANATTISR